MARPSKFGGVWVHEVAVRVSGVQETRYRVRYRLDAKMEGTKLFLTRAEAELIADGIRVELGQRSQTVRGAWEAFEREAKARGVSKMTAARVKRDGMRLLGSVLDLPIVVLTPRRADEMYEALATSGTYEASTHRMSLKVARQFGEWCAHPKRRWLKENPFRSVEKLGKVADRRGESLRRDEAGALRGKLIAAAKDGDSGGLAAFLALATSLRPGEIVQIEGRDIDAAGSVLWIDGARLKNKNTRRQIDIHDPELRALLVDAAAHVKPTERLFPYASNFPTRSVKRIGGDELNARMLRRTFASLAARRGWSLDAVAFGMGHGADSNAGTARRHYMAPGSAESGAAAAVASATGGEPADER